MGAEVTLPMSGIHASDSPLRVDDFSGELNRLLQNRLVTTLLQPVVDARDSTIFGYEALSRGPSDSPLHSAAMLFETAERCGQTDALETLCLQLAAEKWAYFGMPQRLFVNVSPDKLLPPGFHTPHLESQLKAYGLKPANIVIELSERYPTTDLAGLQKSLNWLKSEGFLIAIDDLGSGYSGLKLWSELKPDFVKIDRHFIRDIQDDLVKREVVRTVVDLSARLDCQLIAEGIETEAELRVVSELGIKLFQGFLFGRPKPRPTATLEPLRTAATFALKQSPRETAGTLCEHIEPASPDITLNQAWERLLREPELFALPVVDCNRPLGLLHKSRILEIFSTPYGRALNEKNSVLHFLSTDALVVEHTLSLETLSQRLVEEDLHYLKQHFIVTSEGQYLGLGSTRSLLHQITARKIETARYANPLSLLPGNVPIQQRLEQKVKQNRRFSLIYFDINNFKPLNDVLGYRTGDKVILKLAELLTEVFRDANDFVGHIGGDDFVVITESATVAAQCQSVQRTFQNNAADCYPADAIRSGYVECPDRDGFMARFPLATLAAGLVEVARCDTRTTEQLADIASFAKKRAKAASDFLFVHRVNADVND